jgi:multidrug efflux pump subunit AcrB
MTKRDIKYRSRRPDRRDKPHRPKPITHSLGIAGHLARTFINSALTPLLVFAALAIGVLGLLITPRQEDPQITVPMIDIFLQAPGFSSEQVSSLAIDPLERIMGEIPGVEHVYSAAMRGQGVVTVQFYVDEPMTPSVVKVQEKIQSNLDKIPPGVQMPLVRPVTIDDVPVVTITLWSEDVDEASLRAIAFSAMQRLNEVKNTGEAFIVGGRRLQLQVELLPERLSSYQITPDQIAQVINNANAEQSVGNIEAGNTYFNIYSGAFLNSVDEVNRLVVGVSNGSPIYLRDVARVELGPEEMINRVSYYSGPSHIEDLPDAEGTAAITIAIGKKEGSNGVDVANDILARLDELKQTQIPGNVNVTITRDYGKTANDKVNELLAALLAAAIAVSILCWLALGLRSAIVVITVIPIVILLTVWSAWALDYSINRVSLFALIFSIGILVDDATVVVENIFRRWLQEGETTTEVAIDAVREVGNPTIIATFTIVSALLPMGFVSGMMGPYMRPIPVLGSAAMLWSLVAAFIFTPWFSMRLRPRLKALEKAEEKERQTSERIGRFYRPLMYLFIHNKGAGWILLGSIIFVFFATCAMFYTKSVPVKMLPLDNKPEFNVVVNMPEGTPLSVTESMTRKLVREIRNTPEVVALQSYVGTSSPFNFNGMVRHYYMRNNPWEADIQVMLVDKHERERSSHEIAVDVRNRLQLIFKGSGARVSVVEMPPGPPVLQTMVAEVHGPNPETRRQVARDLVAMFEEIPDIVDVDHYMAEPHEVWRFDVDKVKTARLGISVETVNRTLDMTLGGFVAGDIKHGRYQEPTFIILELPLAMRSQLSRIMDLPVRTATGGSVPLSELGNFVREQQDPLIYHKDLRPVEYVVGEMSGRLGAPIYGILDMGELLKDYTTPDGVKITGNMIGPPETDDVSGFEWTGEWTVTYETFRDMGIAFAAAMVLIYILIVWEFGNFIHPAIIMAPIPLTLIGVIPGHWLLNAEFTATSMIGFIALAGIIVRNSILLVDFAKNEIARGTEIEEAVVRAGQTRMRPIAITTLTLMIGSAAIIFDPIFQGMAISLLFGPLVATTLTLVVIPLGCISAKKALICPEPDIHYPHSSDGGLNVALDPDVAEVFKDPDTVNTLLRSAIEQSEKTTRKKTVKKKRSTRTRKKDDEGEED